MDSAGGGASLHSLKTALAQILKLDPSLILRMEKAEGVSLVGAIIDVAHQLGLEVVATGVESAKLRSCLEGKHCDQIQGFLLSRPIPASFLEEWLKARRLSDEPRKTLFIRRGRQIIEGRE